MPRDIDLRLLPHEAADDAVVRQAVAAACGKPLRSVSGFYPLRQSIDARGRTIWVNLKVRAFVDEPVVPRGLQPFEFRDVREAVRRVLIVGAGPAGLFAALRCLESGMRPVILERGKDVRARRRDLAALNREGVVNPDSNYCFGEGGAGTYSDGKLYTRSHKRGNIERILQLLVRFGADERILYDTHPHIGTNKLPHIITAMRDTILACGGEVHFGQRVTGLIRQHDHIAGLQTADGSRWEGDAVVLATGHSARDIFAMLSREAVLLEPKPFALGVRIEHPQALIDACQYHLPAAAATVGESSRGPYLPPASYSLVHQHKGRGVFSFCMCPGGIIAPAATAPGEVVVNGWSPSKRNNPFANSGMVVEVRLEDLRILLPDFERVTGERREVLQGPLGLMWWQQYVERRAFEAGGGRLVAPAQRVEDFIQRRTSSTLPDCSYQPGIGSANLQDVLPPFVADTLRGGLMAFGKRMRGYRTNEAVLVATESRTSSPVRIPRDPETLQHPQLSGLYPCGEGAGYAGGIVSAAMDGERVANAIAQSLRVAGAVTS